MVKYIVEARRLVGEGGGIKFAPVALNLRPKAPFTYLAFGADDHGVRWFDTYEEALAVCVKHEEAAEASDIADAGGSPEWDYFVCRYVDVAVNY